MRYTPRLFLFPSLSTNKKKRIKAHAGAHMRLGTGVANLLRDGGREIKARPFRGAASQR